MLREVGSTLRTEAAAVDERRLLVLAGDPDGRFDAAAAALDGADIPMDEVTLVGPPSELRCEHLDPGRAEDLMGTTRSAVVLDCHDACRPNVLGRVVGAVDGGGLLVLLVPSLDSWPDRRDGFDETLAVPPDGVDDVTGRFRSRLVDTLRAHPGIAIVDLDTETVLEDGLTDPPPRKPTQPLEVPRQSAFPVEAFEACLTQDQVDAVGALESLTEEPSAVVLEADRGRGKSSAAGLAAGSLAAAGERVVVTAPAYQSAAEVFARAAGLLSDLDALVGDPKEEPERIDATSGGSVVFVRPTEVEAVTDETDVLVVDEAAALPVRLLESFLAVDRVAFATTIHGYEGTGRGFEVRFRSYLEEAPHAVTEVSMADPIRYAPGDPVEVWAFRALLLDARPADEQLVAGTTPESTTSEALEPDTLLADENLLRESFGLLVSAHYRTEPDDLARLLDAPNLTVRALRRNGHVVSVALLAREGGIDAATRQTVYEGSRIRGNMLPDVLMSQLRDEDAGEPVGLRVVRIATHHAVRSRGLGSRLLDEIRTEFESAVDWLGVGFGATPELVDFWRENGFGTIHLATTRNEASGEYSILLLDPVSEVGRDLHESQSLWFAARVLDVLSDALRDMDPDIVRAALRACDERSPLHLGEREWRVVAGASYGPALYSVDPAPFRELVLHYFTKGPRLDLSARAERLLVLKLLQLRDWDTVAKELDYVSPSAAMRSLGRALQPLLDEYGPPEALAEAERFRR
jgi:tRNA(Met) cytidine acetyltransferase